MITKEYNDLYYVCALIEYIARQTKNHRSYVVKRIGVEGLRRQLKDAEVNHCLSFEQVSDELIERYGIDEGDFETVERCKYKVPDYVDIGKLYATIIEDVIDDEPREYAIYKVFDSFLSDMISDFNSDLYYQNPSYLEQSYLAGELLA